MNFQSYPAIFSVSFQPSTPFCATIKPSLPNIAPINKEANSQSGRIPERVDSNAPNGSNRKLCAPELFRATKSCLCGRRHFIGATGLTTALFPKFPSNASNLHFDYTDMLNKIHPPRPDWYEEFYASVLNTGMKAYEDEVAGCKSQLFSNLRGKAHKVLEIGIGTGPNLSYYANNSDVQVVGIDPNRKMEKYARSAAAAAGLPPSNFKFIQAVGEGIPLNDASVDAVVGTLVLCSVKDVYRTLEEVKRVLTPGGIYVFVEHVAAKDGTILRFVQRVLDPLQQTVADGCHLSRETEKDITKAGFSSLELSMAFLSNAAFINPHAYGIARK
ncbi:Methyltransferase-like protein [Quillaja saponaria]|uniref:Methyltransferase-like protein n=1 Tax=Quillaja saponaria TaxID=32244 RepID=A0AAD7KPP2_QUISA|nr:Methyltransferase-like protein [Quillaja saponaria]KAJ7943447.1 Methyltransferase-like protein [Quillaja saponaria]